MKFHDIDSYDFDAQGPIRIEMVATLPASFLPATDTRRILYTEDTQLFYYGDADSWVRFSTYAELYDHIIKTSNVHGTSGSVLGEYNIQSVYNKTLISPHIDDFTNANHNHQNTPGGGVLTIDALPHSHSAIVKRINKPSHGWIVGKVICIDSVNGSYQLAIASNENRNKVFGIVSTVVDLDNVEVTLEGYVSGIQNTGGLGVKLYLSHQYEGDLNKNAPEALGYLVTPLLISDSSNSGYFHNAGGQHIVDTAYAGLVPKLSGDVTTYLNGNGTWVKPSALPVGAIIAWPGTSAPSDFFECNGSNLAIASYPLLYNVLGLKYGGELDPSGVYGNGVNDVTVPYGTELVLNGTTYYRNLTINSGGTIRTQGNTIYVKNTLTINAGGRIWGGGNGTFGQAGGAGGSSSTDDTLQAYGSWWDGPNYAAGASGGNGGAGGANSSNIIIYAKRFKNDGSIEANGAPGQPGGAGGTGGISGMWNKFPFDIYYWRNTSGGGGGGGGGNGGAGGSVIIVYDTNLNAGFGTIQYAGGGGGAGGAAGDIWGAYRGYTLPENDSGLQTYDFCSGEHLGPASSPGTRGGAAGISGTHSNQYQNNAKAGVRGTDGSPGAVGSYTTLYVADTASEPYFKLPDYRGRFLKGATSGANVGVVALEVGQLAHMYDITTMFCIKYR